MYAPLYLQLLNNNILLHIVWWSYVIIHLHVTRICLRYKLFVFQLRIKDLVDYVAEGKKSVNYLSIYVEYDWVNGGLWSW